MSVKTAPAATSEAGVIRTGWATVKRTGLLAFLPWPKRYIVLGDKTLAFRKSEVRSFNGRYSLVWGAD